MPPESVVESPQTETPESAPPENGTLAATKKMARRVVVAVIGGTVLVAGVAMLLLPGPGWVTIAVGLGILATEFTWAARVYKRVKSGARTVSEALLPRSLHPYVRWAMGDGKKSES
jgi:tellurite resistance protein TerC